MTTHFVSLTAKFYLGPRELLSCHCHMSFSIGFLLPLFRRVLTNMPSLAIGGALPRMYLSSTLLIPFWCQREVAGFVVKLFIPWLHQVTFFPLTFFLITGMSLNIFCMLDGQHQINESTYHNCGMIPFVFDGALFGAYVQLPNT